MFEKYINTNDSYIIAEVGQNHQGDVDIALRYIREFSRVGANAIKFQMRDNKKLFSEDALKRAYDGNNSFGSTYGEHREFLELGPSDWYRIKQECAKCEVDFMCTAFDENSLAKLVELDVDLIKIASFDLGNLPFLANVADTNKPIVFSIGGGLQKHVKDTVDFLNAKNANFAVLHCVSEYPCSADRLGLENITLLKREFPSKLIGLSDHFNGILSGSIAFTLGARIFEKHVTFDRSWKGTDHSFALELSGFEKFVRDIRRVPLMYKQKPKNEIGDEYVFKKLGKSVAAAKNISVGETFELGNLTGVIQLEGGIPVRDVSQLIGRVAKRNYKPRDCIEITELE